ncbi:hypothetical protein F5Y15DRAFT_419722 [Xylariaceae sp. FL0016]|nr:hypothetical protein F5Y15DRAFT_419722 [Xylariaceae sp. FL0016]
MSAIIKILEFKLPFSSVHVEALWIFSMFTFVLATQTFTKALPILRPTFSFSKNRVIIAHLILALIEVFRYHVRAVLRSPRPVVPDLLDLLVSLSHSYTSLDLVRERKRGDRVLSRPTHQSLAIVKAAFAVAAFVAGPKNPVSSAFYHLGVVRIMNAFIYPRVIIKLAGILQVLPNYSAVYAAAMFLSCLLCLHDTQLRGAPQVFMGIFVLNLTMNRWVASRVLKSEQHGEKPSMVVDFLYQSGFVELKALRDGREATMGGVNEDKIL